MKTTVIHHFDNYFSANIILTKLENEGIRCHLIDELSTTIYPALGNSIGGIKLVVDNRQIERASLLLQKYHEEYLATAICPICTKTTMTMIFMQEEPTVLTKIFKFLSKKYEVPTEKIYRCTTCNYISKNLP
jgi:Putative prokaryotic signal transducing protein